MGVSICGTEGRDAGHSIYSPPPYRSLQPERKWAIVESDRLVQQTVPRVTQIETDLLRPVATHPDAVAVLPDGESLARLLPEGTGMTVPSEELWRAEQLAEFLAKVFCGDHVEAVHRRLYTQEGVPRYGFKFRPVR